MQLAEFIHKDFILEDLKAEAKAEVLAELAAPLAVRWPDFDVEAAVQVLRDREQLGTTGIGDGVAIPHGKMPGLEQLVIIVARSREGVDYEALDFKPCHVFFLVLAPEQVAGLHLRILAHISRMLSDEGFREAFMAAESRDELWELLNKH